LWREQAAEQPSAAAIMIFLHFGQALTSLSPFPSSTSGANAISEARKSFWDSDVEVALSDGRILIPRTAFQPV